MFFQVTDRGKLNEHFDTLSLQQENKFESFPALPKEIQIGILKFAIESLPNRSARTRFKTVSRDCSQFVNEHVMEYFQPNPKTGKRAACTIANEQTPEEDMLVEALNCGKPQILSESKLDEVGKAFDEFLKKSSTISGHEWNQVF